MKMIFIGAALAAGAAMLPAVADAQTRTTVHTRTTTTTTPVTTTRVVIKRAAPRRGWHMKRVCTVRWHHGRKVRTCRNTRVRW
ncbi:MAG: hypothetical protein E7773_07555 [Sphingomonas sp.]|uniref:hypothetical protein n=1 Tax=Sphingomonas sp. TaxID=28214 RepID=UPI00122B1C7B|nr:hypothetical protein [Sphingomonas sp.]THD36841.1 MAG: hypothetical protein E7773_07555 [Sphingomonas sp.]